MTMQIKCDCCGKVVELPEYTDTSIAPPKGWRRVYTTIDEFESDRASFNGYESEALHSCDDCNSHMTVDEHLEAEFESRRLAMEGRKRG